MRISWLFYFIAALVSVSAALESLDVSYGDDNEPSKNIVFGLTFGGLSHAHWVLAILDIVAKRGFNVTFAAREDFIRYAKPFKHIKSVVVTQRFPGEKEVAKTWSDSKMIAFGATFMDIRSPMYAEEFTEYMKLFRELKPVVVLCDHFALSCQDAANVLNIPFISTSSLANTPDAIPPYIENTLFTLTEPTSLTMSFWLRFYNRFIAPFHMLAAFYGPMSRDAEARKLAGAPPFSMDPCKDSLKLINSAYGFEPARPLGPLVELVGPIVRQNRAPLTPYLKEYLDSRRRIAFIAFGLNYAPPKESLEKILTALLENIEKGVIEGFLWATVVADMSMISKSITLSSGRKYNVTSLLAGLDPQCVFIEEAPQQAVLQHPAVSVFISHAGKSSLYEGLINGKPLVAYPIIGDQAFNARTVVSLGVGGSFDLWSSLKEATKTLETVVLDVTGEIKANVERYGHLVRIRSAHGALKGADFVEEVAFLHQGGKLPHRYEVTRQMSYIKSTNLDLYAALIVVIVGTLYGSWHVVKVLLGGHTQASKSKVL